MRITTLIALLSLWGRLAQSQTLCPENPALPAGVDDLRMEESTFTASAYTRALEYLREFPLQLLEAENVGSKVLNAETWISYSNSLKIVEGWQLKQAALAEIQQDESGNAVARFCEFLAHAAYSD